MKNDLVYLKTSNDKYPMCFNLNAMEEIQEQYGTLSKWGESVENNDGEPNIKNLKNGLLAMINEGIDVENETNEVKRSNIDSKKLGRIISEVGFKEIQKMIQDLVIKSTKTDEEPKNV